MMTVRKGKKQWPTNLSSPRLRKAPGLLEHLVELALAGKFQDEKDALRVVKMAVQLQNIGMAKVRLNFYFAPQLLLHLVLLQLVLV